MIKVKNFIIKTLIPFLIAVAGLLSAGIPYYNDMVASKEKEKGELVSALLSSMDCTIKISTKK